MSRGFSPDTQKTCYGVEKPWLVLVYSVLVLSS